MARGDTRDTAVVEPDGQTDGEKDENAKVHIMFSMPIPMKRAIEKVAEEQSIATSAYVRQVMADAVGFELPPVERVTRGRKYATEEERKAAFKEREKGRRDLIKALLEKYHAGEIEVELPDPSESETEVSVS